MELALNLGWTAMAIAMCWLWVRDARREGEGRSVQLISLVLILITMFAVITIYDDMAMAQNPAETRCFQREDELGACAQAPLHPVVASIPTLAVELLFNTLRPAAPGSFSISTVTSLVFSSIQNRPPPSA